MDLRLPSLAAAMTAFVASPAVAQDEAAKSPRLTYEAELVSDYRFRGVSLSDGEPALQAEAVLEFDSGIWASVWSSTLSGEEIEVQLGIGYSTGIFSRLNLEVVMNYFVYPSDTSSNFFESAAALDYPIGPFTPKIGLDYAPAQAHLRDESGVKRDNLYAYATMDFKVGKTPITLNGQIGYETGFFDTRSDGGKWDWRLGARAETKWANFGLAYVDSNGRLVDRRGRSLAGETVVATLGKSF